MKIRCRLPVLVASVKRESRVDRLFRARTRLSGQTLRYICAGR
jgi:hypothetical protein